MIEAGMPTLHTRVDAWECDFNGHWNTRFYCRSFQTAAEVAAALDGNPDPDSVVVDQRHVRFHGEFMNGNAIDICSFYVPDAGEAPLIAHYMMHQGKIAATSLDYGLPRNTRLPHLPSEQAHIALPRGLTGPATGAWQPDPARDRIIEVGPVRAAELHGDGHLQFEVSVARMALASHHHDTKIGYTQEFTRETGIGRMLVEMRFTRLGPCAPRRV